MSGIHRVLVDGDWYVEHGDEDGRDSTSPPPRFVYVVVNDEVHVWLDDMHFVPRDDQENFSKGDYILVDCADGGTGFDFWKIVSEVEEVTHDDPYTDDYEEATFRLLYRDDLDGRRADDGVIEPPEDRTWNMSWMNQNPQAHLRMKPV